MDIVSCYNLFPDHVKLRILLEVNPSNMLKMLKLTSGEEKFRSSSPYFLGLYINKCCIEKLEQALSSAKYLELKETLSENTAEDEGIEMIMSRLSSGKYMELVETLLENAVENGNIEIINLMSKKGADNHDDVIIKLIERKGLSDPEVLKIVELLMEKGDVDYGMLLYKAIENPDAFREIINRTIDVEYPVDYQFLIETVIEFEDSDIVRFLIEKAFEIGEEIDYNEITYDIPASLEMIDVILESIGTNYPIDYGQMINIAIESNESDYLEFILKKAKKFGYSFNSGTPIDDSFASPKMIKILNKYQ